MRVVRLLLLAVSITGIVTGCARVKPWQRGILSKPVMTFDSEVEENTLDHGFYNAREGTAGGFGSGGGGCGCN